MNPRSTFNDPRFHRVVRLSRLPIIGFIICMAAFAIMAVLLMLTDVPMNITTWTLWVVIDTFLLLSLLRRVHRPWTMIGFEIGACVITFILIVKYCVGVGDFAFGSTEKILAGCAFVALLAWAFTSGVTAIVLSTIAMYVAMGPTFIDMWRNPVGQSTWFWAACSVGAALEFFGKPKTVELAFFPACAAIANGAAAALCARQYFM